MNKHLKKVPIFLVIGMSGYAAWPVLFPESISSPPPAAVKPPAEVKVPIPEATPLVRNPFRFLAVAPPVAPPGSPSTALTIRTASDRARETGLPQLAAEDEAALSRLRLTGTHIEGLRRLAVIDGKVYAQGESLKDREGKPMAYSLEMIHGDRVVLRRERRNFVLGFPERPKVVATKPGAGTPVAKAETRRGGTQPQRETPTATRGPVPNPPRPSGDDQKDSVLKLLTGLVGQVPGASGLPGADGGLPSGLGGGGGLSLPAGVDAASLSAGIDALMGKLDNIGRTSAGGNGP